MSGKPIPAWKVKVLANYPGVSAMIGLARGMTGKDVGDQLAEFVYHEVMDSVDMEDAYTRLNTAKRDIEVIMMELDNQQKASEP